MVKKKQSEDASIPFFKDDPESIEMFKEIFKEVYEEMIQPTVKICDKCMAKQLGCSRLKDLKPDEQCGAYLEGPIEVEYKDDE